MGWHGFEVKWAKWFLKKVDFSITVYKVNINKWHLKAYFTHKTAIVWNLDKINRSYKRFKKKWVKSGTLVEEQITIALR